MKSKLLLCSLFILMLSCESETKRFYRIAEDNYIYKTSSELTGVVWHIDSKCKKIQQSTKYTTVLKKELEFGYNDEIAHNLHTIGFCPVCTTSRDIEKLKSQISFYHQSK